MFIDDGGDSDEGAEREVEIDDINIEETKDESSPTK
jgi:hypothetical protein